MRVKFTTTLEEEYIRLLRIIAAEKSCKVNDVIEEMVKEYVEKRTVK